MMDAERIERALKRFPNAQIRCTDGLPFFGDIDDRVHEVEIILIGRGACAMDAALNALGLVVRDRKKKTNNRAT